MLDTPHPAPDLFGSNYTTKLTNIISGSFGSEEDDKGKLETIP
ncbi:hypothetical protein [Microseira sp. BLCC-F43]